MKTQMNNEDKRHIAALFRQRFNELITQSELSYAQFAQISGLDRSTLSQILSHHQTRLPRMETIYKIAFRHKISTDWLLGLSQNRDITADIFMEIETADHYGETPALQKWREEVRGRKIRYIPATLPNMLKTEDILEWEFNAHPQGTKETKYQDMYQSLDYNRHHDADTEVCLPMQSLEHLARGTGIWKKLNPEIRKQQIRHMTHLIDELYPTFRCFLYDGLTQHAAAYTVFGQKRAAIYIGGMYFVFTSTPHITILTAHFNQIIRNAKIQPHECADYIKSLKII